MNTIQHYTYDEATNLVRRVGNTNNVTRHYQPVRTTSNRPQAHSYDTTGNQQHSNAQSGWRYQADGALAELGWQAGGYQYQEYYTYAEYGQRARKVTEVHSLLTGKIIEIAMANYIGNIEFRSKYEGTDLSYDGDTVTDVNGVEVSPTSQRTVTRIKTGHGQVGKLDKNELTGQQRVGYNALNHIDSNELALDEEGNLNHYRRYAPYGDVVEEVKADDGNPMELGYSGQEHDDSGLVYYGYRYLQTKQGIWNRADPIRFASGQLNLYSMLEGNPVSGRDKLGLLLDSEFTKFYNFVENYAAKRQDIKASLLKYLDKYKNTDTLYKLDEVKSDNPTLSNALGLYKDQFREQSNSPNVKDDVQYDGSNSQGDWGPEGFKEDDWGEEDDSCFEDDDNGDWGDDSDLMIDDNGDWGKDAKKTDGPTEIEGLRRKLENNSVTATIILAGGKLYGDEVAGLKSFYQGVDHNLGFEGQANKMKELWEQAEEKSSIKKFPEIDALRQHLTQEVEFIGLVRGVAKEFEHFGVTPTIWRPTNDQLMQSTQKLGIPVTWKSFDHVSKINKPNGMHNILVTVGHGSLAGDTQFMHNVVHPSKLFEHLNLPTSPQSFYIPLQCHPMYAVQAARKNGLTSQSVDSNDTVTTQDLTNWVRKKMMTEVNSWISKGGTPYKK